MGLKEGFCGVWTDKGARSYSFVGTKESVGIR